MCLSTIYENELSDDKILMDNVASIECDGENIILKDLFEKELKVKGKITEVSLLENYAVINTKSE